MTPQSMQILVSNAKKYARIDYDDDDDLVETMVEATLETMLDVIPGFVPEDMTGRQKIILYRSVKNLYDDRELCGKDPQEMKIAAMSMLLSEIYEPKGATAVE